MKGLVFIPSVSDLTKSYEKLQGKPDSITVNELALWSQWARFDPRLGEQWIAHILKHWRTLSPIALNVELQERQPWPAAAAVLLEQARVFGHFPPKILLLFRRWCSCALTNIKRAQNEQFFIGLRSFGGKLMLKDAEMTAKPYQKWGFLGCDILINKAAKIKNRTLLPLKLRKRIAIQCMKTGKKITVNDYMNALDNQISRRQAELDLAVFRKIGNTKGRFYVMKK